MLSRPVTAARIVDLRDLLPMLEASPEIGACTVVGSSPSVDPPPLRDLEKVRCTNRRPLVVMLLPFMAAGPFPLLDFPITELAMACRRSEE